MTKLFALKPDGSHWRIGANWRCVWIEKWPRYSYNYQWHTWSLTLSWLWPLVSFRRGTGDYSYNPAFNKPDPAQEAAPAWRSQ